MHNVRFQPAMLADSSRSHRIRRTLGSFILVAFLLLLGPNAASVGAQQTSLEAIGIPPFTTMLPVENGYINTANGDLHLEIPLGDFPERAGQQFKAALMYDSNIWESLPPALGIYPYNVQNAFGGYSLGGWRLVTSAHPGWVHYDVNNWYCTDGSDRANYYGHWRYTAPDGTTKLFSIVTTQFFPTKCNQNPGSGTPSADAAATDGSGYHIYVTNYTSATVYAPDGTAVFRNLGREDANGNYSSFPATLQSPLSDTLGRTVVTTTTSGNLIYYDVLNSQGTTSRYTVTTETINTNAGSPNFPFPGTITVFQSIQLPDGTSYSFNYDTATNAGPPYNYGTLTSMTMPTGGKITYSYATINLNVDDSGIRHVVAARVTPDSTTPWNYTYQTLVACSDPQNLNGQYQLTVTKPSGDNEIYKFSYIDSSGRTGCGLGMATPAQLQIYSGSVSAANLVTTLTQTFTAYSCWVGSAYLWNPACNYMVKSSDTTTLPVPGGTSISQSNQYTWDSGGTWANYNIYGASQYGQLLIKKEWSFYTGSLPASPDRTTTNTYLSGSGYLNSKANILDRRTNITVTNASGATVAQTVYSYDGSALVSATGVTNHDDTNFGTSYAFRGNLTKVQRLVSGSTYLTTSMTYDMTGQVRTSTDSNGNVTAYDYTDHYLNGTPPGPTNAYATTITAALPGGSRTATYFYGTGQVASSTDPNNQPTSYTYDNMDRPLTTSYPDLGQTSSAYNYNGSMYTGATATKKINSSQNMVSASNVDVLGRIASQVLNSDPSGQTTVATTYDSNGRVKTVSNPYRSTSDSTYGLETYNYDGLDRRLQVTRPDGSIASTFYGATVNSNGGRSSQLCSGYGIGYPLLYKDEAARLRQTWTDGFGRLIEVDEPDPSTGSLTSGAYAGSCYGYDLNNNLTGVVTQGSRTRSFTYDLLSRLTIAMNPESGTTNYYYTTSGGGLCAGDISAVCYQTDARSITTTYTYDTLNRLTWKRYSDGTLLANFLYDVSSNSPFNCPTGAINPIGRLSETSNYLNAGSFYCYDPMGRVLVKDDCLPAPNGCAMDVTTTAQYDLAGDLTSLAYPSGRVVTTQYNAAMQLTQVTFASFNGTAVGYNYMSASTYSPTGASMSTTLGSGVTETECYNNRLQPGNMAIASAAFTWLNRTYNFYSSGSGGCSPGSGNNNGVVLSIADNLQPNRTQTFLYDYLNRISTAQSAATSGMDCWGQSFGYDAWANLLAENVTKCSGTQLSVGVNAQNRITNAGISYDASGDMLTDGVNTYTYDAEGRINTVNGSAATYIYYPEGNRAYKQTGGGTTQYVYFNSQPIAERSASGVWTDYIFAGSRRLATSNGSNLGSTSNAGFEQGLTNWTPSGSCAQLQTNFTNAHSGSNYVQISIGNGAGCSVGGPLIPVTPGQQITFGGWVNLQSGSGSILGWTVGLYNSSGGGITSYGPATTPTSSGWTYQTETFTVPAGVAYANLYAQIWYPNTSTVLWVDDGFLSTGTAYYHADHLGSARVMSDTGGNVMWLATYLPFGQEWNPQATVNHYKFTGKERDSESGLDNFGARYDSSQYGRFMTPDFANIAGDLDESGNPQTWNAYAYVQNNPLNAVDPDGKDCIHINNDTGKYEGFDSGDCDNSTEEKANSGYYVNGKVDTIYTTTGNAQGAVTGYSGSSDSGGPMAGSFAAPPTADSATNLAIAINALNPGGFINGSALLMVENGAADGLGKLAGLGIDAILAARAAKTAEAAVDLDNLTNKIVRQMASRGGWTKESIVDTIQQAQESGDVHAVTNKMTGGAATEYVSPSTGRFVVVDNATKQVIQVSGSGFKPNYMAK